MIIFSHRGNSSAFKYENTIEGFKFVKSLGITAIEYDIRQTSDQELVVFHDKNSKRIGSPKLNIKKSSFSVLEKMKLFDKYKIAKFSDVLELSTDFELINIEIKQKNLSKPINLQVDRFIKFHPEFKGTFLITSTKKSEIRVLEPTKNVKLGLIINFFAIFQIKLTKPNISVLVINSKWVSQKIIDFCHSRQILVYVYTVNNLKKYQSLVELGVDGIYSDMPDKFSRL